MHEIARAVVLSRSGLTRLIDRLEAEGLLSRTRSNTDRRGAYAVLTAKGLEAVRQAWPTYAKGISQHFTSLLNDEEVHVLTKALERILASVHEKPTVKIPLLAPFSVSESSICSVLTV